jgi:hypothetical protein
MGKAGRPKGSLNKTTTDVRKAIAQLAELNIPKLNAWLSRVALQDPARAAEILLKAIEYHIPKLGRTEVSGPGGEALTITVVEYRDPDPAE